MVEGKEIIVSGPNVMNGRLNGGAGYGSFFIRANNQEYHNVFPDIVQSRRRHGSFKIINADNSKALQRLTEIDVLSMQFDSCEAAESFYHRYASAIGFVVADEYLRRNQHGEVIQKRWACNSEEEGFQQKKHLQNEVNCFAGFCIGLNLDSHKWLVREFVATHTHHELSPTCQSYLQIDHPQKNFVNLKRKRLVIAQAPCKAEIPICEVEAAKRKCLVNAQAPCKVEIPICDMEAAERKSLVNAQSPCTFESDIPMSDVEAALDFVSSLVISLAPCKAEIPSCDMEAAKRKSLVNAQPPWRSDISMSDVEAALDFLNVKKDSDPGLFYETKFVEGQLASLFWADSIYQLDNACFGEVMTVYRTKLCMMHFVVLAGLNHHHKTCVFGCALLHDETVEAYTWLFQTFLHVMQGCMPISVVTDDHEALREAIKLALPRSRHRLCTRHLEKTARSTVNNPFFISDFKVCMLEVLSPDDFELIWKRMVRMYKVSENPWIQRMHRERHMWAETYLRGSFSAGLQSTSICETIDKHLRKSSQNKLKLHEFLNEFEYAINALWREEGKAEYKSICSRFAPSNPLAKLKNHAAHVFTRESYKRFLLEIQLETCLFVVKKDEGTNYSKYRLCNIENQHLVYEVMVKPSGPTPSIKCSCLKFETLGFPCCHAIHVMKSEGMEKIPQDLIHPRWTKSAKSNAQFWKRSLPRMSSDIIVKMMRHGHSASISSMLCYLGTKSEDARNLLLSGYHELEHEIQELVWCIQR